MTTLVTTDNLDSKNLKTYAHKEKKQGLLRFLTCGSVDDGKSTLIGRLLHDTKQVYDDQLISLANDSKRHGSQGDKLDLAFLVDGLQAEREQGITIDVAYRYFSTNRRKFIIADTPGHEQYTRNMATGASTCDLAILLIDARKGILQQTRRHSLIATLLGLKHLIVAINKMDLVNYRQDIFQAIQRDFLDFLTQLPYIVNVHCIPISALEGINVTGAAGQIPWYKGSTLLDLLETIEVNSGIVKQPMRFPVQYINRPNFEFRGYSGTLSSGVLKVGQLIKAMPSGIKSNISRIITFDGDFNHAIAGEAITVVLQDEIDISRGDILIDAEDTLIPVRSASIDIVWMADNPLTPGDIFNIKIANKLTSIRIDKILYQINIHDLTQYASKELPLNAIGRVDVIFNEMLSVDPYEKNQVTGSMIIIDRLSNATVGAGMIRQALSDPMADYRINHHSFEIELNALIRRHFPHWGASNIIK
ncbi:Sulfate adenylyltransferase subunit 1 [Candidatus Erwinia haradaeae]|uniref:Sulfate adenylyltransferase subunit 1 n=1 Tax=Candidatus Erwinia haradaeae TaxID=1922217 RepID=A0A451DLL1_9GAMM|nr:sulfate adenylyltransferase subunit CysN [Candidatus Erwinia haradaeae]VFP87616.1 Sulfate adenylyltransferase subunit 1 [Candidatus Erwinia haradaeae]